MTVTKGNGPDAANDRPAKKYTDNATDFIAPCARVASIRAAVHTEMQASTSSPAMMFSSWGYSKPDVADVADVAAPIHAGFGCNVMLFSDVADVAARRCRRITSNGAKGLQVRCRFQSVRVAGAFQAFQVPFQAGRCAGIGGQKYRAMGRCAKVPATPEMGPVRRNIVNEHGAQTHALSWVFSRLEFKGALSFQRTYGFGRDGRCGNARRMACSMFLTSRPPDARRNADGGFQSQHGAESMTTVNTTTTPKKGILTLGTTPATSPVSIARRIAIEAALSLALFHVRHDNTHAAVGRAIRAASMLKQACAESTSAGSAA